MAGITALLRQAWLRRWHLAAIVGLFALAVGSLGKDLFSSDRVLSSVGSDVAAQYLYTRQFGFGEMALGNLPLWNPYLYGGVPFLGDFQSALLYPLNLIFLFLPLPVAINWSFALHVFILGAAMYAWASFRGIGVLGAFVAGAAAMFGGAFFPHIFAGHLSNVCSMAWAPLIFCGIDGWLRRRHAGWILLSAAAVALQVYAGNPQYTYFSAVVAGVYSLAHLPGAVRMKSAAAGIFSIYPLAFLLSAVQVLPGLDAAAESVRSSGTNYGFASMFGFPPMNYLTLLSPWCLGSFMDASYWGRCYLWEMMAFAGTGVLLLAICGIWDRRPGVFSPWRLAIPLAAALLLALGSLTPLHRWLYDFLPGFNLFRGASKFAFFSGLFVSLLSGFGIELLLRGGRVSPGLVVPGIPVGFLLLLTAGWLAQPNGGHMIQEIIRKVSSGSEIYYPPGHFSADADLLAATARASEALWIAGFVFLGFSLALLAARRWRPLAFVIAAGVVAELFLFARGTVASFSFQDAFYAPLAESLRRNPGDFRIISAFNPDAAIALRKEGIWGYEPSAMKRYGRLVRQTQRLDPDDESVSFFFRQPHPVLDLLRCRVAALPQGGGINIVPTGAPLPRYFLATEYEVLPAGEIFERLREPFFDLSRKVLLENQPFPPPDPKPPRGQIRVVSSLTDCQIVEVITETAALFVITDSYSKDWRVTGLPGSAQTTYTMLPADYAIRAVPLAEGRHILKMEYVPAGLGTGLLLTLLALGGCGLVLGLEPLRKYLDFRTPNTPAR